MEEKKDLSIEKVCEVFGGQVAQENDPAITRKAVRVRQEKLFSEDHIITPAQIYAELSKTVLGQEKAKKSLAVILYQHLKRFALSQEGEELPKTNALMIGPSGCGKTMLAKALADVAKLPFLKIDATNFTQRGYRGGMNSEQIVDLLRSAAKDKISRARWAIVFIDEVDKLAHSRWGDDALATSGIQQDLLSIIDGGSLFYESDHEEYSREEFDFSNVLFIFSGAFEKINGRLDIGVKELVKFGFIPEFANRLGSIIQLEPLPDEVIKRLIKKEVRDYKLYFQITDPELSVYTELIHSIITTSNSPEAMGGRCVGPAVRRFFEDLIFEVGNKEGTSDAKEKK